MSEFDKDQLHDLAVAAHELQKNLTDASDVFERIAKGIARVPEQLQAMIDQVVNMQREFPMPEDGWKSFVEDIEHTNEKHGLNLRIKPELLGE